MTHLYYHHLTSLLYVIKRTAIYLSQIVPLILLVFCLLPKQGYSQCNATITGNPSFIKGSTTTLQTTSLPNAQYCWQNQDTPWQYVGIPGFSAGSAESQSLVINGGTPYVAFSDGANGNRTTVMKFNGASWELVGSAGFSPGPVGRTSLAFDGSIPYLAFSDLSIGKTVVMKFNGNNWAFVGGAGFGPSQGGLSSYRSLAINNGTPYVAFQGEYVDGSNGSKASVVKFDGTNWVSVGTAAGFSNGLAVDINLVFNDNIPYVAFTEFVSGYRARVMRFDGANWVNVGIPGFSAGFTISLSFAFSGNTPYVAYYDGANGGKTTVMKFDGSSWGNVGNPGFSAGPALFQSLAFDGNTPYVAYQDQANDKKTTVMKFDGANWVNAGNAAFSAGEARRQSLAFDGSTPYVAYSDAANGNKTTVMKLDIPCESTGNSLTVSTAGTYTVRVTDQNGCVATSAPVVVSEQLPISAIKVDESCPGRNGSIDLTITDPTGTPVISWTGPDSFNASVEDLNNLAAGIYKVVVTDDAGATGSLEIEILLIPDTEAPLIVTVPDNISVSNDPGLCSASVGFSAIVNDNCDTDLNPIFTLADGTQINSGYDFPVGQTTVNVNATDAAGNQAIEKSFMVTVTDDELPVLICKNFTYPLNEQGEFTLFFGLIDQDLIVSSTDNCGLVTGQPGIGVSKFSFTCNDLGDNEITIFNNDINGNQNTCTVIITITDPLGTCNQPPVAVAKPLTISADANCEGIATAADFNGGSIDPDGDVISFGVFPAAPYSLGTTPVTLMVTDSKGASSTATTTITVEDKTDPVVTVPANITVGNDPGQCGAIVTLTTSASDNCSGITLVMNVDDGKDIFTSVTTPLTGDAYFPVGTTTVTVDATDAAGNKAIQKSFTVTVTDSEAPVITLIAPTPTAVLGLTNTVTLQASDIFAATDKCSGDLVFSPTVFTFDCDNLGENIVSVSVTDAAGNTANANATVTISDNVALSIDASESGTPVPIGSNAVLKATVSPAVEGVEVTFLLDGVTKGTAMTDASGLAILTVNAAELGSLPVVYKVSATIEECTGLIESVAYLPIYDPNGNFVTGGGWIMSPAGSYKADESLEGKANFGFVSKYKKGSNRVDGNTEFEFHAGDLYFKSTLHESGTLVISGKRASYRGEGSINDVPGYNFTLVALDGNYNGEAIPDQFRIKIWGASGIVYDNGLGADDNSDVSTVLGGGSITIHEAKGKGKDVRRETTDPKTEELENSFEEMELSDEPMAGEFRLYPNPAQKETSVMVDLDQGARVAIRIYDAVGRLVLENEAFREESFVQTFNLDGLAAGFYTVQVKAGDILMIKRLIKK